jgi:hypothetical protein
MTPASSGSAYGSQRADVSTDYGLIDLTVVTCGFIGKLLQRNAEWALYRWTPKSLKRWLASFACFDERLSWLPI